MCGFTCGYGDLVAHITCGYGPLVAPMHRPLGTVAAWMLWLTLAAGRAWHWLRHWTCINDLAITVRRWKRWLFITLTCYIGLSETTRQRLLPRCCIFDFCQQLCFCASLFDSKAACFLPRRLPSGYAFLLA